MAIVGILLGIGCLIYFSYKGLSIFYLAPLCALVVAIFNGLNLFSTFTVTYMGGLAGFIIKMFPMTMLGAILGRIYGDSGAAKSVAKGIMDGLSKKGTTEKTKQLIAVTIIMLTGGVLTYGGIDAFATLFATFALAVSIMKENNIPRRFLPVFIVAGPASGIMALPGSPQLINIIPTQILKTSPTAALIPGIIVGLFGFIASILYINYEVTKAKKNGEIFEIGTSSFVKSCFSKEENKKLPNFFISLIPMVTIFIVFNIFKLNIVIALAVGVLLSIVLFFKYISEGKLKSLITTMNEGSIGGATAIISIGSLVGFGTVVAAGPGFKLILTALTNAHGAPLWIFALSVGILSGISGSAPGGIGIALPLLAPIYLNQFGINPAALHRVATVAATTLDTLPSNAGVIWIVAMAGLTHKEAYKPIGVCTIIITSISTVMLLILLTLFPGLA